MLGISIGTWLVLMLLEYIGLQIMIGAASTDGILAPEKVANHFNKMIFDGRSIRLLLFLFTVPLALHASRTRWAGSPSRLIAALVVGAIAGLVLASASPGVTRLQLKGFYLIATMLAAVLLDLPRIWAIVFSLPVGYLMLVMVHAKLGLEVSGLSDGLNNGLTVLRLIFFFVPILLATRALTDLWSWAAPPQRDGPRKAR